MSTNDKEAENPYKRYAKWMPLKIDPKPVVQEESAPVARQFSKVAIVAKLPIRVDLRSKCPPVYDQGTLGSCTAQSCACIYSMMCNNKFSPSRLFVYYNERMMIGTTAVDSGAYLEDGIQSMVTYGSCSERSWPHIIRKFTIRPPPNCYTEALNHQVLTAQNLVNTVRAMQTCLASGVPFVVAINVYSSFLSKQVSRTGIVPMPNPDREYYVGGHAVVCVGYDHTKQWWIMRNSWGARWGVKGYFYLPYDYLIRADLSSDLWNILETENASKLIRPQIANELKLAMQQGGHLRRMIIT